MKIKVADLEPNPYRKMDSYPIDRAKVEALKTSIQEKTFWDNILARKRNNKYELAYGHHRWIALQELGIKEIDIPVRDIDDATMVKIMAEENLNWTTTPAVINETVLAAKEFLDGELAKAETWAKLKSTNKSISSLFEDEHGYRRAKAGVGQTTILKFLGGNWKQYMIQEALDTLRRDKQSVKEGGVDRKAVEMLPTQRRAKAFKEEVIRHKIPKLTQREIAKEIEEKDIGALSIPKIVFKHAILKTEDKDLEIIILQKLVEDIDSQSRQLSNKIMNLRQKMKALNIEQLQGVKVWLTASSLNQLFKEIKRLEERDSYETNS